jgi:phospholipase/carboxylesterase
MKTTWHHIFHRVATPDAPTLLLLHGTGGNEHDLVPLGRQLLPDAHILSPRGPVSENGAPRFFRRLAEGVFDLKDLHRRTAELNDFLDDAIATYGLDRERIFAVGFSNGANIAASLLLSGKRLGGALLLRPMTPFTPETTQSLGEPAVPVRLQSGQVDPIVPLPDVENLARLLYSAGATVEHAIYPGGHGLTQTDLTDAQAWLERVVGSSDE